MDTNTSVLQKYAIDAAMINDWRQAIKLNQKIIKQIPDNLNSYLRLGFAYLQSGNLLSSKKAYLKALKIQPSNQIALNNLEKIKILKNKGERILKKEKNQLCLDPNLFLNIPGKTKVISLINLGQISILAKLKVGQGVILKIKKRRVEVRTENDEYIGALPDDISKRLILFIKAKTQYTTYIKKVSKKNTDIFIKEEKKGRKVRRYPSFPKNFQEDLKTITSDEEGTLTEDEINGKDEIPIDLEKLAEEVEEKDYFSEPTPEEEKEDFEE